MAHGISRLWHRAAARAVDPTIYFSFDRTGYRLHARTFDPTDLDVDLTGQTCAVTGANSGIGYAASVALARLGAEVLLLCRNPERGAAALARLRDEVGRRCGAVEIIDMASLASVRTAADRLAGRRIDVLVHNAGVLPTERTLSPDGLELTLATHVVGPLLLTALLLPGLRAAPAARVVWVTSGGMYTQRLRLDDPQWERTEYDGVLAYARTKRMQVVLNELLAGRLAASEIASNAMHPGWADTPAVRSSLPRFWQRMKDRLRSPAEGADTIVWLAASARVAGQTGKLWFDRRARATHYLPFTTERAGAREALWRRCLEWAGLNETLFSPGEDGTTR